MEIKDVLSFKEELKKLLIMRLEDQLNKIIISAKEAHGGATHEEAVAKSKYDTHGLELSYLAGSLYNRASHLESAISKLKKWIVEEQVDEIINIGSVVHLAKNKFYLLIHSGAGESLDYKGTKILVISPESPLGEEFIELGPGDIVTRSNSVIIKTW